MTSITSAATLNQQLYMRLLDKLDVDKSDGLSAEEVAGGGNANLDAAKVFQMMDRDGDGRIIRAEMTPSSSFGADTLNVLLTVQSDPATPEDRAEIIADLFERADLDGDGVLNAQEMDAERAARQAANLDAGYMAGPIFVPMDRNRDGLFTQDEIGVGAQIKVLDIPSSAIHFLDELPPEEQARFNAIRQEQGLPPAPVYTAEEKQRIRDQMDADRAERASGPAGTTRFLQRELDEWRAKAGAQFGADDLSGALTQRLLNQILGEAWSV